MRLLRSPLLLAALLFVAACAHQPREACAIDPNLVPPEADADRLPETHPFPYAAEYQGCGKALTYVAARHTNDPQSTTYRLIEIAFARRRFGILVIEGVQTRAGVNPGGKDPKGLLTFVQNAAGTPADNEGFFAARLAIGVGTPLIGGEPSDVEILAAVKIQGLGVQDLFAFYVLRYIEQWRREQRMSGPNDPKLDQLIRRFAPMFAKGVGVAVDEIAPVATLDGFKSWYRATNGLSFEDGYRPQDAAPRGPSPRGTNLIAMKVGDVRERAIISVINDALRDYGPVFVVYGGSHHTIQAPALEAAFGPPKILETDSSSQARLDYLNNVLTRSSGSASTRWPSRPVMVVAAAREL